MDVRRGTGCMKRKETEAVDTLAERGEMILRRQKSNSDVTGTTRRWTTAMTAPTSVKKGKTKACKGKSNRKGMRAGYQGPSQEKEGGKTVGENRHSNTIIDATPSEKTEAAAQKESLRGGGKMTGRKRQGFLPKQR